MQLRNFVRRHKWRLRPVKRAVLPLRNLKRVGVALFRKSPVIARSTAEYDGASLIAKRQIHPAESVSFPAYPFEMSNGGTRAVASHVLVPNHSTDPGQAARRPPARELHQTTGLAEPAFIFELKNIDFWGRYG